MRQLSLFDVSPAPAPASTAPELPSSWEHLVPACPLNTSNRHWTMLSERSDPVTTLLAVLYVCWRDERDTVIHVPHTGKTFRGQSFLADVYGPYHVELERIARQHNIRDLYGTTTVAWRGETRTLVQGPFRGQSGLRPTIGARP